MNASVGLAFGMTQVGYLGSQTVKFLFAALKYTFKLIFNPNNVIGPLKFLMKLLFGFDIGKVTEMNAKKSMNHALLDKHWKQA